jgi:hydroxypyruvate isomerase
MEAKQALQVISIPHRPVPDDEEINKDLAPAFDILEQ